MVTRTPQLEILGPDGRPYAGRAAEASSHNGHDLELQQRSFGYAVDTYLLGLARTALPARSRARDPYSNHAWVFAAATAISTVAGQANYVIMRESEPALQQRLRRWKAAGYEGTFPPRGLRRRAVERWSCKNALQRLFLRSAEPDLDHPLNALLRDPNPYQSGNQLMRYSLLWYALRGEVFWLLTGPGGRRLAPGDLPAQVWPIGPDLLEPLQEGYRRGELVSWRLSVPDWLPLDLAKERTLDLGLDEVVQFKQPNPQNPMRGMSRLTAVAQSIETDLLAKGHVRSVLQNSAVPKGLITYEGTLSVEQQTEYLRRWNEQFKGDLGAGRTALMAQGFKYQTIAMSPDDLQFVEREGLDRDEILAVMGCPRSVVGVTEFLNYATQLGQDLNFWDKTILPIFRDFEGTLDRTLFAPETDAVFGLFDVRHVEALRAGLQTKLEIADKMTGQGLHAPPRVAYDVVGLEVAEYEGDEVCLVPALATPLADVLQPADPAASTGAPPSGADPAHDPSQDPGADPSQDPSSDPASAAKHRGLLVRGDRRAKASRAARWRAFVKLETKLETKGRGTFLAWGQGVRRDVLRAFDEATGRKAASFDLTVVLPDLAKLQKGLKAGMRPTYAASTESIWDFTVEEIGIPTFSIDDAALQEFLNAREAKMVDGTPVTLQAAVRRELLAGVQGGETVQAIRARLVHVFDVNESPSKALTWARTEVGGLMNGVRDQMFGLQGFDTETWSNAGDEVVRPDHVTFGAAGPQPRGFNYLDLVQRTDGVLAYPGDLRGPVDEVANCRCLKFVES